MNLTITGHHLEVTPAIRGYVEDKMARINRHFDQVIDVSVILAVEKLKHKAEVNLHLRGKDIYVEAIDADMYAAIDALTDKLDRQVVKHKEKAGDVHRESGGLKRQSVELD
jgi:putative sigma-54 modulation protein